MNNDVIRLQEYMNALKNGDKDIIYYAFSSQFDAPQLYYNRSSDICSALVVILRTRDGNYCQGIIPGKEFDTDSDRKIRGVWISIRSDNLCEIILEFEKEQPLILSSKEDEQIFMLFAEGEKHAHLCLYDDSQKGDAFSLVVSDPQAKHYLASIASLFISPFLRSDLQSLPLIDKEACTDDN